MLSLTLIIDLEAFAEDLEFFVLQQAIKNKTDYSLELLFLDYLSKNPAKSLTKLSINCFFLLLSLFLLHSFVIKLYIVLTARFKSV